MGTIIYNNVNKLSRIVELVNESEKEVRKERVGTLLCIITVALAVSLIFI